jgi:hypothetical protein
MAGKTKVLYYVGKLAARPAVTTTIVEHFAPTGSVNEARAVAPLRSAVAVY